MYVCMYGAVVRGYLRDVSVEELVVRVDERYRQALQRVARPWK